MKSSNCLFMWCNTGNNFEKSRFACEIHILSMMSSNKDIKCRVKSRWKLYGIFFCVWFCIWTKKNILAIDFFHSMIEFVQFIVKIPIFSVLVFRIRKPNNELQSSTKSRDYTVFILPSFTSPIQWPLWFVNITSKLVWRMVNELLKIIYSSAYSSFGFICVWILIYRYGFDSFTSIIPTIEKTIGKNPWKRKTEKREKNDWNYGEKEKKIVEILKCSSIVGD